MIQPRPAVKGVHDDQQQNVGQRRQQEQSHLPQVQQPGVLPPPLNFIPPLGDRAQPIDLTGVNNDNLEQKPQNPPNGEQARMIAQRRHSAVPLPNGVHSNVIDLTRQEGTDGQQLNINLAPWF